MSVVSDDAEARVGGVFLHDATQGHLGGGGHGVGLVEDDELVGGDGGGGGRGGGRAEDLFRAGEGLDLLAHDIDTAVIRGVELENHLPHARAVYTTCESEDRGGFSCAGRTVEEEMGESLEKDISGISAYLPVGCCSNLRWYLRIC